MTTAIQLANDTARPGDRVSYLAPLAPVAGRVSYATTDGWVGVTDETGRTDEYRADRLYRH